MAKKKRSAKTGKRKKKKKPSSNKSSNRSPDKKEWNQVLEDKNRILKELELLKSDSEEGEAFRQYLVNLATKKQAEDLNERAEKQTEEFLKNFPHAQEPEVIEQIKHVFSQAIFKAIFLESQATAVEYWKAFLVGQLHTIEVVEKSQSGEEVPPPKTYDEGPNEKQLELYEKSANAITQGFSEALKIIQKYKPKTFAIPAHSLMLPLLALFAGKNKRIPRQLLRKPPSKMTPEEREKAEEFVNNYLEREKPFYDYETGKNAEGGLIALVSDNPIVRAKAEVDQNLFKDDYIFQEGKIAEYAARTFGPEGIRHFLAVLIALDEQGRTGLFQWKVNDHLERMGRKKTKKRSYDPKLKEEAIDFMRVFTGLTIVDLEKKKGKMEGTIRKLLNVEGADVEISDSNTVKTEGLELSATRTWYQHAFNPPDGEKPIFTKLLRKIAQENHQEKSGLCLYLAPFMAVMWRLNGGKPITWKVKTVMEWCNLDHSGRKRAQNLKDLESTLEYMKEKGYLGSYLKNSNKKLSELKSNPFTKVLNLAPPNWLTKELKFKEAPKLPQPEQKEESLLSIEDFKAVFEKSGLTTGNFANILGVSRPYVSYIKNGKKPITSEVSKKVREKFGHLMK